MSVIAAGSSSLAGALPSKGSCGQHCCMWMAPPSVGGQQLALQTIDIEICCRVCVRLSLKFCTLPLNCFCQCFWLMLCFVWGCVGRLYTLRASWSLGELESGSLGSPCSFLWVSLALLTPGTTQFLIARVWVAYFSSLYIGQGFCVLVLAPCVNSYQLDQKQRDHFYLI